MSKSTGKSICIALAILFAIGYFANKKGTMSSTPTPIPQKTQEELRKEKIERHFSQWDGSHKVLTRRIKESMNDPDSYEHVGTTYMDMGNHLIVTTEFRGKNAFGGVVLNWIKVKVDGNVIEVIAQGP